MVFVLDILALTAISLALSLRSGESMAGTFPVALGGMGLVLYVLAFFRALALIHWLLGAALLTLVVWLIINIRRDGSGALRRALAPLKDARVWVNATFLAALVLLVRYRCVLEWDAYNFWGADIKSLVARGGFAERYSNVAPSYGDYPPFTQLMIWWFLSLFGGFDEGLVFGGYFFWSGAVLLSVTGRMSFKGRLRPVVLGLFWAAVLFALPSAVDTSWYRALYVDPVMGILFGVVLAEVWDGSPWTGWRTAKCAVYLSALALTKTIGMMWVAWALVLFLLRHGVRRGRVRSLLLMALPAVAVIGAWTVYCRVMVRTTDLTASIAPTLTERVREILDGSFLSNERSVGYVRAYIKAFLSEPVHRARTLDLDLTPALVLALALVLPAVFRRAGALDRGAFWRLFGFTAGMYAVTYVVLMASHLTIFYGETQYLESANMLTQMTRYGAPMNIGSLILAVSICFSAPGEGETFPLRPLLPALMAGVVLLSAGYGTMADCLIEGHDVLDPQRIEKRESFRVSYSELLEQITDLPVDGENRRVLVLLNSTEYNPIVSYLASPMSLETMYYGPWTDRAALEDAIERSGASWVFVQGGSPEALGNILSVLPGLELQSLYPVR